MDNNALHRFGDHNPLPKSPPQSASHTHGMGARKMDKARFETALGAELTARYDWARDPVKLRKFMESVAGTIRGEFWTWNHDGEACAAAWRTIGGKGKPTMKALRALPESAQ